MAARQRMPSHLALSYGSCCEGQGGSGEGEALGEVESEDAVGTAAAHGNGYEPA